MGAIGAALLARETIEPDGKTRFRGFDLVDGRFEAVGFACDGCPNSCEVVEIGLEQRILARWGDRCGKWSGGLPEG